MTSAEIAKQRLKEMQTSNMNQGMEGSQELKQMEQSSALDIQEGGSHYKNFPIQPVEYITANAIPFMEGSVIKYVSRHASKNGAADIRKAIHFLELILELIYKEKR